MASSEKKTLTIEARLRNYLKGELSTTQRLFATFGLRGAQAFERIRKFVFSTKTAVAGLIATLGAYRAVDFLKTTAEQTDALAKLAASTGDVVENLSELEAAFKLEGVSDFSGTVEALAKSQAKALNGNQKLVDGFGALGITLEELANLGPSQLFEQIAVGLDQFATEQERSAKLAVILKGNFVELLPILARGESTFREAIENARRFGSTMDGEVAGISDSLGDSLDAVGISIRATGRELIRTFGPQAAELFERLALFINENKAAFVELSKSIAKSLLFAFDAVLVAIAKVVSAIDKIPGLSPTSVRTEELLKELDLQQKIAADAADNVAYWRERNRQIEKSTGLVDSQLAQISTFTERLNVAREAARQIAVELGEIQLNGNAGERLLKVRDEIRKTFDAAISQPSATSSGATSSAGVPALGLPSLDALREYAERAAQQVGSVFRSTRRGARPVSPDDVEETPEAVDSRRSDLEARKALATIQQNERALARLDVQARQLDLGDLFKSGQISAQELTETTAQLNEEMRELDRVKPKADFWDGFSAGAEQAVAEWQDFEAAGQAAAQTLISGGLDGLSNALVDGITGVKSFKEAFRDFAKGVLRDIAQVIVRLTIMRALGLNSGGGFEKGGVGPGVDSTTPVRNFARGGVVNRPTTAIFGEGRTAEAFVPLPDNRSIPVSFVGGSTGQSRSVNVTIVAMDSRDVRRALVENQGALRGIFENQLDTRKGLRGSIAKAAR
jgi:hypothetical protein